MRRAILLLAALLALPAPAVAISSNALVVSGTHSGYVVLHLDEPLPLNLHNARVSRAGRYGGLAVDAGGFVLTSDDIPVTTRNGRLVFGAPRRLPAGTYLLHLISDGSPVRVTVPWSRPNLHLEVDAPSRIELEVMNRTVTDGVWHANVPLGGAPAGTRVYGMALYESRTPLEHEVQVEACLTASLTECAKPMVMGSFATAEVGVNGVGAGFGSLVRSSVGYHVVGRVVGAAPLDHLTLVWLRYRLPE